MINDSHATPQLRPAEELRRPDKHGQLPHIILTLSPNTPLDELESGDIVEINWNGVLTAIRDATVRVEHEGDLSSSTLHETIQLIALALKRLEIEDADNRRALARSPHLSFFVWLVACTPGSFGARARALISERGTLGGKIAELQAVREKIFQGRITLARLVDIRVHALLVRENAEYREMEKCCSRSKWVTAKRILEDFKTLADLHEEIAQGYDLSYDGDKEREKENREQRRQLIEKVPVYLKFATEQSGKMIGDIPNAEFFLRQSVDDFDTITAALHLQMGTLRNERKSELYSHAAAALSQ